MLPNRIGGVGGSSMEPAGNTEPAVLAADLVRAVLDEQVAEDCLRRAA
ncbi:hypothetical protein [Streptomyces cellulosae]|nr:hypothetical protein [Streptomyces cellulosae]